MLPLSALPLNALRAVEAVGRLGSLAAASADLNITSSAVSQHVQNAEARLGVALFDRTTGTLVPTATCRALLPRLTLSFTGLVDAVAAARQGDDATLTVATGPAFASTWLVPRLARFAQVQSGLRIRLVTSAKIIDLARSDADVAVRLGQGEWPGLVSERLLEQSVFPVASPAWAARLNEFADLARVPIIRDEEAAVGWRDWLREAGANAALDIAGPSFSDTILAFEAALAGQGVMLAWSLVASDALRDGRLVRPFEEALATASAYWLVATADNFRKAKVRAFRAWLRLELAL